MNNKEYQQKWYKKNKLKKDKQVRNYYKTHPWVRVYSDIKQRCTNKNHKWYHRYGGRGIKCEIVVEELKELWIRDKAYLMKRPSIDRINNDGDYTFENCEFIGGYSVDTDAIDYNLNCGKTSRKKPILQYDLNGNFIREFKSVAEAQKQFNTISGNISRCLVGKSKHAYGYIWRNKYDID